LEISANTRFFARPSIGAFFGLGGVRPIWAAGELAQRLGLGTFDSQFTWRLHRETMGADSDRMLRFSTECGRGKAGCEDNGRLNKLALTHV